MAAKEAKARIKINKLLEEAGWRFFDGAGGKANVVLEPNVKLSSAQVDAFGENFEETSKGYIDFLLLDETASRWLSSKPSPRTRTLSSARNRRASTPSRKIAGSSFSPTATCTISGICSKAIRI